MKRAMADRVEAVYENGILRPVHPLVGIPDQARVQITIERQGPEPHVLAGCIGSLPDDDAEEMKQIVQAEFETVHADDWR